MLGEPSYLLGFRWWSSRPFALGSRHSSRCVALHAYLSHSVTPSVSQGKIWFSLQRIQAWFLFLGMHFNVQESGNCLYQCIPQWKWQNSPSSGGLSLFNFLHGDYLEMGSLSLQEIKRTRNGISLCTWSYFLLRYFLPFSNRPRC